MQTYIYLKDIQFHAFHGVGEQERVIGNSFTVNLRLAADFSQAMKSDKVSDTVSYADVYEAVKAEMQKPSLLLEHAGGRIVESLFEKFPAIEEVRLRLDKRNPPMNADIASAGIEIIKKRNE